MLMRTLLREARCRAKFEGNAGGKDTEGKRKQRLLSIFGDWTDMVTDLIR